MYFGDATQPDLLNAAGAGTAQVLVVAIDDTAQANRLVDLARQQWPHLRIVARARDAVHAMELHDAGVSHVQRAGSHPGPERLPRSGLHRGAGGCSPRGKRAL